MTTPSATLYFPPFFPSYGRKVGAREKDGLASAFNDPPEHSVSFGSRRIAIPRA